MFESTVVRASDRRFAFLPLSLALHSVAIAAVIAASVASTRLPQEAPRQMTPIFIAAPPPALGTPTPSAPKPRPALAVRTAVAPEPAVAPQMIPDTVTPVAAPASSEQTGSGTELGIETGRPGGVGTSPEQIGAPDASGPLVVRGDVKAPVAIRRVDPLYPPLPLKAHMNGWVVLQCVIDRSGHIRDVRVVSSSFAAFEQSAIDAVQQWLFAPGTLNGQPVDTIFELTVRFQIRA